MQAENGTAMQGAVVAKNNAGYTGTGFVDYVADSGGTVTWRVSGLAGPGNYVIDFRYANGSSSARRLQIDAANNPSRIVSFTPTGSWSTWKTLSVPVTVTSGTSVTVTATSVGSNGPNLDSLTVRPAGAPAARTFQAEQAAIVGAQVSTGASGYTGSGFVDFLHNTGDSIEWTIDNPVAGVYALVLRYANGSTGDRSAALWVNGRELNGTLGFASTGSWSNWREVSWTAPLNAGTNRIRLQANGRAAPNVDSLTLRTAI